MIHPSYVELMKVVNDGGSVGEEPVINSRYNIVCATAKRARQLIDGAEPLVDMGPEEKPLSIAVEELYEGKLRILTEDEAAQKAYELALLEEERARREAEEALAALEEEAALDAVIEPPADEEPAGEEAPGEEPAE